MSVPLGGIEAYLNQLQFGTAGQAARNTNQQTKVESTAAEVAGMTPKADRKDGFSQINAAESNAASLKKEPMVKEETRGDLLGLIKERLERGENLSDSDMRYLRNHDPALYQKAKQVQDIRDKFSNILQRAKRSESATVYREVLAQAQKAKGADAVTGEFLVKAIENEYKGYRGAPAAKTAAEK